MITPKQLHDWYLDAVKAVFPPDTYNPNKPFDALIEEQKAVYGYIAKEVNAEIATLEAENAIHKKYIEHFDAKYERLVKDNARMEAENATSAVGEGEEMKVRAYLKNCATYEFPVGDTANAREIAYRIITEGLWVIHNDGTEEYYPITEIQKAKIIPAAGKEE